MGDFWQTGLHFSCTRCGTCCRGEPGYVMLSANDIQRMSSFLSMPEENFLYEYCRPVRRRDGVYVSLIEKKNYDCIFWEDGCRIYSARPLQCSAYPFWFSLLDSKDNWNQEKEYCPGVGNGSFHSGEEIAGILAQREQEPYVFWDEAINSAK